MSSYYNENDPSAAATLRNLIAGGHIAPGDVDERSIEDVRPSDLYGYTQHHFFAGVGVWSYALRRSGWDDNQCVWTGSCPCQPFSSAGKGAGFDDERHLWPAFYHLLAEYVRYCRHTQRPAPTVFGEQVASKNADAWIDLVHADLEALDYAFGCVPFPSAGVGAPHIRDRTYWMADAESNGRQRTGKLSESAGRDGTSHGGAIIRLGDADHARLERHAGHDSAAGRTGSSGPIAAAGVSGGLADADGRDASTEREQRGGQQRQQPQDSGVVQFEPAGPTNGFWGNVDWLLCRDDKWRPVEPGTFPLVDGASNRVGRLRGYGNAINAEQATIFIEEALAAIDEFTV